MSLRLKLFWLALALPALAQPWASVHLLVVPGRSLGPIELGKPVPVKAYELLGASNGRILSDSKDSGGESWSAPEDVYINVKCHDGRAAENVFQIFWTAPGPRTAEGVGVGSDMATVLRKLPAGQWGENAMDGTPCWKVPGLTLSCDRRDGKVYLMHLYR